MHKLTSIDLFLGYQPRLIARLQWRRTLVHWKHYEAFNASGHSLPTRFNFSYELNYFYRLKMRRFCSNSL